MLVMKGGVKAGEEELRDEVEVQMERGNLRPSASPEKEPTQLARLTLGANSLG